MVLFVRVQKEKKKRKKESAGFQGFLKFLLQIGNRNIV